MIDLGSKAKDSITGFTGIVIGRTEWLYGCTRIYLESQALQEGKCVDPVAFDEQRVEELESAESTKFPVSPARCGIEIQLGNKVKDKLTGFTGTAVSKTIWSSGNVTIQIESNSLDKGLPIGSAVFDYHRIELIQDTKPQVSAKSEARTGGPQRDPKQAM
jgi:hypothetical protein